MKEKMAGIFFSFSSKIIFTEIGGKLRPGALKGFMDFAFSIFEKVAHNFKILSSNYLNLYEEIVENEIKLGDITSKDTVLVIGCGSLPSTAALIYKKTKASITGIDVDPKATKRAVAFLDNLHLKNKIKIDNADGLNYQLKNFDVILILYGVKKQKQIFEKLSKEMKKDARIILRCPSDTSDKIVEENIELDSYFIVKDNVTSRSLGTVDSFLLLKKD